LNFLIERSRAAIFLRYPPWENPLGSWDWTPDPGDAWRCAHYDEARAIAAEHDCADVVPAGQG